MQETFGSFLKQKRLEKQLTQKKLASILFVSESTISKWEQNVAHPDISLLPKLSEILGVSEHELITASIDKQVRNEKIEAKKWRTLSKTWSLFFYISYSITILTCFICNLAVNKTLSWFWIVLSSLILSFTFTNLPSYIKKYKLIFIPLSIYISLVFLLGVCAIYTHGNWFLIAILSILLGLSIIFTPIYIAKYEIFSKIRKYNDFISILTDFVLLNILLITINIYTNGNWYLKIALPIASITYIVLNILLCVRFLKLNKLLKTSIILFLIDLFAYLPPLFIKFKNPNIQEEMNDLNILKANFSIWNPDVNLDNNVNLIIFFAIMITSIMFLIFGLIKHFKTKTKK